MPWSVDRVGDTLVLDLSVPMNGEWEAMLNAVADHLTSRTVAVAAPKVLEDGTELDAEMLSYLWKALSAAQIPVLPAHQPVTACQRTA